MSRATLLSAILLITCFADLHAQERLTTFILVRHAEKVNDGTKNPRLTDAGKKRAEGLVSFFKKNNLSAIYSTAFTRTLETVSPLAKEKALTVITYDPTDYKFLDLIVKQHKGETVLICGHSNTIPKLANYLSGTRNFTDFADNDYGNIIVVTVGEIGNGSTLWLRY